MNLQKLHLQLGVFIFFSGRRAIAHQSLKDVSEQSESENHRSQARGRTGKGSGRQSLEKRERKTRIGRGVPGNRDKVEVHEFKEERVLTTCFREVNWN